MGFPCLSSSGDVCCGAGLTHLTAHSTSHYRTPEAHQRQRPGQARDESAIMARAIRYNIRVDNKQSQDARGASQVKLTLIAGVFVVLAAAVAAVLGAVLSRGDNDGSSPGQDQATNSSAPPSLSAPAMALIDRSAIPCRQELTSPVSDIGDVTISSPPSGAVVSIHGTVRGTAKLSGADQLYFFAYPPGACAYYFQPGAPVSVEPDGSWQVQLYLDGNKPGDKVGLYAAVLGPDAQAILEEILHHFDVKKDKSPHVLQLPSGTRAAHINVELSP